MPPAHRVCYSGAVKNIHQNREISTLSFNERVLQEAEDPRNPLMERLRFLGIFSSNMDEFFKVRVASIQRRLELGQKDMGDLLEFIGDKSRQLDNRFQNAYVDIVAALEKEGIRIVTEKALDKQPPEIVEWVKTYFRDHVLPSLVPIIVNENLKFPRLKDGALYFAVRMWGEKPPYAILEIPDELARFVELPNGNIMYVDDIIRYSLNDVFYIFQYDRIEAFEFKISRDAELDIDNDFSEDFVQKMRRVLEQRKGGRPTRFVYDRAIPPGLKKLLLQALKIRTDDTVIGGARYHNMKDLMRFPSRRKDLYFDELRPAPHPVLDNGRRPILDIVAERDVLVTYPYQSFDHIIRVLREAAIDPEVEEIKMTLYRAAQHSQVVNALVNAARNGKRVFVPVEIQARFDERHNIYLAEKLADVGAAVAFGVPPMKVHAKLFLIRRKGKLVAGLSTGNFNEVTGKLYVDSTLLTSDKRLTKEVDQVFEFLNQASRTRTMPRPKFKHLIVSPFDSRKAFLRLLDGEMERGESGYVLLKVNHLTDDKVIKRLRRAADAGVKMDLIARTTYAMRPHENIRAISIVDRFLEHQRVYIFGRGEDRRVFLSSMDLMERNLDWRVEAAFPVYDPQLRDEVVRMMEIQVQDTYKARLLDGKQSNAYVGDGPDGFHAQPETYRYFRGLSEPTAKDPRVAASA